MQKEKRLIWGLLLAWGVFNLIQAAGMELDPDEAYYWVYSQELDWGYFDHPPIIAVLIKTGFALFPSELGVRLGAVLLQLAGFIIIWDMLGRPLQSSSFLTLAALFAAIPMLQVYGFIATPDSPLLFFVIVFFYIYQRFLKQDLWLNVFLLGLVMALMLYSKYHGLLVILFTLFSNWKLLKNPRFYLASIFGVLLFLPHLYWQYNNGFPSFSYHLIGRDDLYKLKHTTTYLINQLLIFSPFLFPLFIQVLLRRPAKDQLERALRFVIFGFWIFFFLSTFKGHAEPQWTALISIPLIILSYRHALENPRFSFWIRRMAVLSIGLLVLARLFLLLTPWKPDDFRDQRWIYALQERADGKAVVFENSYRDVSKYYFYTRRRAYTLTDVKYRKNQFDLWNWEASLHRQAALIVGKKEWDCEECERFRLANKDFKLMDVPHLEVAQKLYWDWNSAIPLEKKAGEECVLEVRLSNPYKHPIAFGKEPLPVQAVAYFLQKGGFIGSVPLQIDWAEVAPAAVLKKEIRFTLPKKMAPGLYQLGLSAALDSLPPPVNSPIGRLIVR